MDSKGWTYGAELEFADIPQDRPPCKAVWRFDRRDITMVNSNGIAVDAKGKFYKLGAEINTVPTNTVEEQVENFKKILKHYPEAAVNHRTGLHIHVHVPGLKEDMATLKKLQWIIHTELKEIIQEIEPLPPLLDKSDLGRKSHAMRKKSHQTFLTPERLEHQLAAKSLADFFTREVPKDKKGSAMWHAQSRCAVNLRQLRETDTIEFRHFSGTIDPSRFLSALIWCTNFLEWALEGKSIIDLWHQQKDNDCMPKVIPYDPRLELGYSLTSPEVPREQRMENIQKILNGELL